jgi:LacI family transcriptional regulator
LRTQRSNLIGVLVPRLSDLVLATIYEGIDEAAEAAGYQTFVANSRDDPAEQRTRTEMFLTRRVDGLILGDAHADHVLADALDARGVPFVLVSRHTGDYTAVTCDDLLGGSLAARHLLELGHLRAAVIAGEPFASTGIDRTAGFVQTYTAAGAPAPAVAHSTFDVSGGRLAAQQLLGQTPRPTALFAVNDFAAIGALGVIRDLGLIAGRDIAVIGYNDVSVAAELPIPLTTIRSPMHAMGHRAVELLVRKLEGDEVPSELLVPTLVARATTTGEIAPEQPNKRQRSLAERENSRRRGSQPAR